MTKIIQGFSHLPYKERLKKLNLHSLEQQRMQGDLIKVFKWVKGINKDNISKVLVLKTVCVAVDTSRKKFSFRKEVGKTGLHKGLSTNGTNYLDL